MNAQDILPGLKAWFEDYVLRFSSDDPIVQESMDLKREHSLRVCEVIVDIGRSLDLSREDLCTAEASALLHDIGRFEQYRQYRTFFDYRSEDHAALGVKVIQANRVLHGLESVVAEIIVRVVGYHNRAALPAGEDERCLFFLKLLRDADKVDIWRVVADYYQNAGHDRNQTIELDLPDRPQISDAVYKTLMNGKLVQMTDLKTLNDFKMLQIGWIYDINFPRTFEIIRDNEYLEIIRDALPETSSRAAEVYERARAHLESNFSSN
ncbi:MAG: HD domain-containing protein [Thermodesulfobacteriota bacterium]|nr:HD domain-containing protein [Thermodesulfobacteriota bacterium]